MEFHIGDRRVGPEDPPLVIAEIGINHEGHFDRAVRMVDDARAAGCECVKFQSHVVEDEMIPNDVVPGNTTETIWDIMVRCALTEEEEFRLKAYVEEKGMIFLSTPFSRAAAERLRRAIMARLHDRTAGRFHWAESEGRVHRSSWDTYYPDALAQLFPVLYGVIPAGSGEARTLWREFASRYDPRDGRVTTPSERTIIELTRERVEK